MTGLMLDRRSFLRGLGFATGTASSLPLLEKIRGNSRVPRHGESLHVVILGAGLAGLCAALELERRGHRVTILEAERDHLGGRVRTARFAEDRYGELGAMRIPASHDLTLHYAHEFGLRLRPFVLESPETLVRARGRCVRHSDLARLAEAYDLRREERDRSPAELWAMAVGSVLEELGEGERDQLLSPHPAGDAFRRLDRLTLRQLAWSRGLSSEAIAYLGDGFGVRTLLDTGATEHLREELLGVWEGQFQEIIGGMDRLPAAFASRLDSAPRTGCRVVEVFQDGTDAGAVFVQDGREERVCGDAVICTIPFPVLAGIRFTPRLDAPKSAAIRGLTYDSATKVLAEVSHRFWETELGIFGGGSNSDLPTGSTWYPADNSVDRDPDRSRGPAILLASYSFGMDARRVARADRRTLRSWLAALHPELDTPSTGQIDPVRRWLTWSWDDHPWSQGAFAWFGPGQHGDLHRHAGSRAGRIHFAGEHTSLHHTWMQGALESGLRAVDEILRRT